jgi:hypothetical protein
VQKIEDLGGSFTGGASDWAQVISQVQLYAQNNFGVATTSWTGCSDAGALSYTPDNGHADTCISADFASWPAVQSGETSKVMRLRVRLPSRVIPTGFGRILGFNNLTINATAVAAVQRATTTVTQTVIHHVAGGPCALCVLGPGLALDGQNGDITVTGGNVVVDSTASTAASLNPNGHVTITTQNAAIGGPGAPGNFSGTGYSPTPSNLDPVSDPLAGLPMCGTGSTCPSLSGSGGNTKNSTLSPGIYSSISNSHTLNPGIYVLTGDITLNGNDLITGSGVMLYFACSNYPNPCSSGQVGAGIKATGNGAMRITPPTSAQCPTNSACNPYIGLAMFADRNNTATFTYRGNGTNENGILNGGAGTFYMKSGTLDLRGNGYTLASEIVVGKMTMEGNPSGVTIAYDQSRNVPLTHDEDDTTTTTATSYDASGLVG